MEYHRILSKYPYAELRIERSFEAAVSIKDEEVKHSSGSGGGTSIRVLDNGSWGLCSNTDGTGNLEEMAENAQRLARLSSGKIKLADPSSEKKEIKDKLNFVEPELQVKGLLEAAGGMKAAQVTSRSISCTDNIVRKEFYNSAGAEIIQEIGYTYLSCSCVARDGDVIQRGSDRTWSRSGFTDLKVMETAAESREQAIRLLKAAPPPKGRFTVVFDPEMTGVFSHEAVGHACEADSVIDRESILSDKVGKKIGNDSVTIIDDPTADDFGRYAFDEEGTEARPTVLVEKGVLRGFMNSMETAEELNAQKNGHARAQDYAEPPIVRMSNTYFQKGGSPVEEVFSIKEGVYLKGMKGGSVDIFSGGFMFKSEEAYEIKNGEKGTLMRDVTITGNILQTLLDVECVGNDFGTSPGICGKFSQEAPVSDGGPHIRVRNVAIG